MEKKQCQKPRKRERTTTSSPGRGHLQCFCFLGPRCLEDDIVEMYVFWPLEEQKATRENDGRLRQYPNLDAVGVTFKRMTLVIEYLPLTFLVTALK